MERIPEGLDRMIRRSFGTVCWLLVLSAFALALVHAFVETTRAPGPAGAFVNTDVRPVEPVRIPDAGSLSHLPLLRTGGGEDGDF
jgi:hypothetical protein